RRSLPVREPLRVVFPRPVAASRSACPVGRILTVSAARPREYPSCYPLPPNLRRSGGGVNVIQAQRGYVGNRRKSVLALEGREKRKSLANKARLLRFAE